MPQISARILHFNQIPISSMNLKVKPDLIPKENFKLNSKLDSHTSKQNNSNLGLDKKSRISNIYSNNDHQTIFDRKKSKNSLLFCKSISKKLFSKAKIIQNPHKQTYLSPPSHQVQNVSSQFLPIQCKKNQMGGVSRLSKARSQRNLLTKSPFKLTINSPTKCAQSSKNSRHFNKQGQNNKLNNLYIDNQQIQEIAKNNLFTSINGLKMLQSLERNLRDISNVEDYMNQKDNTTKNQNNQHIQFENFMKISKVQSIQIEQNQHKSNIKEQSQKINYKQEQNIRGSISRLILGSQFTRKISHQVNLSELLQEQSIN